jgi:hypothetical protein
MICNEMNREGGGEDKREEWMQPEAANRELT